MARKFINCIRCKKRFRRIKEQERICPSCNNPQQVVIETLTIENEKLKKQLLKIRTKVANRYASSDRKRIIDRLGGVCVRCGFSDWRALQIDHVRGGGRKELKEIGKGNSRKYYIRVLKDTTGKYQLLCANCNWIKRWENNEF